MIAVVARRCKKVLVSLGYRFIARMLGSARASRAAAAICTLTRFRIRLTWSTRQTPGNLRPYFLRFVVVKVTGTADRRPRLERPNTDSRGGYNLLVHVRHGRPVLCRQARHI